MLDVTTPVVGMMFLASSAISEFTPPSRKTTTVSVVLLLAAGVTIWMRIHLPISRLTAHVLFAASVAGWAVFIACVAPKLVRKIKAFARD